MIYLGADHGGYELKEKVKKWLDGWGYEYEDLGAGSYDPEDDYPVFVEKVASRVASEDDIKLSWHERAKGILLCRSGGGMVMGANRFSNVRAVQVANEREARHARTNNDANAISLAGDWVDEEDAKKAVKTFLETEFGGEGRHKRRLAMVEKLGD